MKKNVQGRGTRLTPQQIKQLSRELGRSAAIFIKQLDFWISSPKDYGIVHEGKTWIFNSLEAWGDQLCLSRATIARVVAKLTQLGILEVKKLSPCKAKRTNYYTLNTQALAQMLGEEILPAETLQKPLEIQGEHITLQAAPLRRSPSQDETIYISNNLHNPNPSLKAIEKKKGGGEEDLAQHLLDLWNEATGQNCQLTVKRMAYLKAALERKFEGSIDQWKAFCEKVASSDFLMGRVKATFRASLDWVLKFDTITRILEGDFGVRCEAHSTYVRDEVTSQAVEADLVDSNVPESEKRLRLRMLAAVGGNAYKSWFQQAAVEVIGEGRVVLRAASAFASDYIQNTFGWKLEDALGAQVRYAA